jgi:hypothetical protein
MFRSTFNHEKLTSWTGLVDVRLTYKGLMQLVDVYHFMLQFKLVMLMGAPNGNLILILCFFLTFQLFTMCF